MSSHYYNQTYTYTISIAKIHLFRRGLPPLRRISLFSNSSVLFGSVTRLLLFPSCVAKQEG